MSKRAVLACGLCGVLSGSCSNGTSGSPPGSTGTGGSGGGSLVGTWHLTTGAIGGPAGTGIATTVTIGQDSLDIASPSFTLTATRTGNVLAFADNQ
jgi:hypothetical protein